MFMNQQKGFSLVELMVGLVIGLLAIFATYRVYESTEANQRALSALSDTQISGLFSIYTLNQEITNAGAILLANRALLNGCTTPNTFPPGGVPIAIGTPTALPLFPLPVAIIPEDDDPANPDRLFDEVHVFYGIESRTDRPIQGTLAAPNLVVGSAMGIDQGSVLLTDAGNCRVFSVATATPAVDPNILLTLAAGSDLGGLPGSINLLNMGQVVRRSFYVDANNTLQMRRWVVNDTAGGLRWVVDRIDPIASNVRFFRAQYGVDINGDRSVDVWRNAGDGANEISVANIINGATDVETIRAIRVGLVFKSDEPDKSLGSEPAFQPVFFNDCPGTSCGDAPITPLAFPVADPSGVYGWRHRKYETIIPIKNTW
jgi:prepilin-type N-terminal cleavage/methylation domain